MMTQTVALFVDAYRELNAKKLFWITLGLSALVVGVFAIIGIDENGMSILWFELPFPISTDVMSKELFYKSAFLNLGIGIWLTWAATILALVSTAGIFPSLVTGGQVETMLSKPISRTRLYLTKYLTGLLFVTLQVTAFSAVSMIVIGARSGSWMPEILISIPIVVLFYSYLFSLMALLGLLTRSTIASLLLTVLLWFVFFLLSTTDMVIVQFHEQFKIEANALESRIERLETDAAKVHITRARASGEEIADDYKPTTEELDNVNVYLPILRDQLDKRRRSTTSIEPWRKIVFGVKTLTPKTGETIALLNRYVMSMDDIEALMEIRRQNMDNETEVDDESGDVEVSPVELAEASEGVIYSRSLGWIVGTSLGFEAVMLLLGVWAFSRRDF